MEAIVTVSADEQQALPRTIGIGGMPAPGARFARVVGIYHDRHAARKKRLVGKHGVQLGE